MSKHVVCPRMRMGRKPSCGIGDTRPTPKFALACLLFIAFGSLPAISAFAAGTSGDSTGPVKVTKLETQSPTEQPPVQTAQSVACQFAQPPTAKEGEATVRRIAKEEHFDIDLVVAIARQESRFRADSVSSAGAIGLMQLMPATARRFEVDICDPDDNVRGGVRYLKLLEKKYANPLYVLAAYNAGEAAVDDNRGIPLYPETVNYVVAILTDLYGWQSFSDRSVVTNTHHQAKAASDNPAEGSPEAWSQGFVLHVE
jgi:hypothetical protein